MLLNNNNQSKPSILGGLTSKNNLLTIKNNDKMRKGDLVPKNGWYACSQEGSHENTFISWAFCDTDQEEAAYYARNSGLGTIQYFTKGQRF